MGIYQDLVLKGLTDLYSGNNRINQQYAANQAQADLNGLVAELKSEQKVAEPEKRVPYWQTEPMTLPEWQEHMEREVRSLNSDLNDLYVNFVPKANASEVATRKIEELGGYTIIDALNNIARDSNNILTVGNRRLLETVIRLLDKFLVTPHASRNS